MKSLESEGSPLRSQQNFYKPFYKLRQESHKKNFQSNSKQNPVLSTLQPIKTKMFLDEMQKSKHIHRGFYHQQQFFPNPEKKLKRDLSQYKTSDRLKSKSSFSKLHHKSISTERQTMMNSFFEKSEKKKELNLSFYNTKDKRKYYMQKFNDWTKMQERGSPTYQKMMNRTIALNDIMQKVKKNERRFIKGF